MPKEIDRRKYPRLYKSFKVEIRKLEFPIKSQKLIKTKCLNISAGGMSLKVTEPFKVDDTVQVFIYIIGVSKFHNSYFKRFEAITDQKISGIGKVVRVNRLGEEFELGIEFVDVYEDDWKALYDFICTELNKNS